VTQLELYMLIVDCNAVADSCQVKATEALESGRVGGASSWLAQARRTNMLALRAWELVGRTDLLRTRDMAAFARAQLGLPIDDNYPARGTPLDWHRPARAPRFGRVVEATIVGLRA
jgi:hypothetical protein